MGLLNVKEKIGGVVVWEGNILEFCFGYIRIQMFIRFVKEGIKERVGYIYLEFKGEVGFGNKNFGVIDIKVGMKSYGIGQDDIKRIQGKI